MTNTPADATTVELAISFDEFDREHPAHFDRPETAWFTMCNPVAAICWVGQGSNPLVELPGRVQASFLPLGFEYGG